MGAENYVTLRGLGILEDQAAQPVPAQNLDTWACGRRPPGGTARLCPVPPDQIRVPAQQSPRGDDQAQLAEMAAGQQAGQHGHDRAVGPGQLRRPGLGLEHGHLVTQDQDLGVLGVVRAGKQGEPAKHAEHRYIRESQCHEC